jgi:structure-specific endonuclease subunit SLX1
MMSNLHLLLRVPSFSRWPLKLHFFNTDVFTAWQKWCKIANDQLRPTLVVVTDFDPEALSGPGGRIGPTSEGEEQSEEEQPQQWGINALPLDYEPIKDYVTKGKEISEFERQGKCVVCSEKLPPGDGLHAVCTNASCDGVGHLSCWSRHFLAAGEADCILPVQGRCPKCKEEVHWGVMMKELTLRVRGNKEVEKLLKQKRRRATKKASKA